MTQNKRIIGITGGSGTGKSYISSRIEELGVPVIDCDKVAREVVKEGSPCLLELTNFFGADILEKGVLNRRKLASIVFSDEEKLEKLNEITHKYILESIYNRIKASPAPVIIVDGAVLLESGFSCDKMVGIVADRNIRKTRIMARDGISEAEAEKRISAQKPDEFYFKNCDAVFVNSDGNAEETIKRIME